MVRRTPAAVIVGDSRVGADVSPGQLLQPLVQGGHVGLDGHDVVRAAGDDQLSGVGLYVHRIDGDDRAGQVREGRQEIADRWDLVRLRRDSDLSEDGSDAMGQRGDQVRRFRVLVACAADGLTIDRDH
jgi:hypothetical protein